ncbi:MAG: M28 family peptidase [Pseudomonadota bacterium]
MRPATRRFATLHFVGLLACGICVSSTDTNALGTVATIDIQKTPIAMLEKIKHDRHVSWWAEFGDTLVVGGTGKSLALTGIPLTSKYEPLTARDLSIVIAGHQNTLPDSVQILARGGRTSLIIKNPAVFTDDHILIQDFKPNTVYAQSGEHNAHSIILTMNQALNAQSAMDDVDAVRWFSDVGTLSNWNRHVSSVDIVSARDWIQEQFLKLAPTSTSLQKFNVRGRDAWNVIATFDAGPTSDVYVIGGHYDSISEQISQSAPGAEDNASGAAGVIELARVFSSRQNKATLIFVAFSGEEEGLVGSKAYVINLPQDIKSRIKSVLTMDMIGYSKDDSEDVLLETASKFKPLSDQYAAAARLVPGLRYFTTFNPFGSDHMPFIDADIPAILTIDNDWGDYPTYHRTGDTIDKVSRDMGLAILKMNAATLAVLTGS